MTHDDAKSYGGAIEQLAAASATEVERLRDAGYAVLEAHRLSRERAEFSAFLDELDELTGIGHPAARPA